MRVDFFKRLLIFVSLIVAADLCYGILIKQMKLHDYVGDVQQMNYKLYKAKADIVIFGSSRAAHHYNPIIIDSVVGLKSLNYGDDLLDIYIHSILNMEILKRYNPKMVLLDIRPDELLREPNHRFFKIFNPFVCEDDSLLSFIQKENGFISTLKYKSRFYCNNPNIVPTIVGYVEKKRMDEKTYTGFTAWATVDPTLSYKNLEAGKYNIKQEQYLLKFADDLRERHIPLLVIISPLFAKVADSVLQPIETFCIKRNIKFISFISDTNYIHHKELFCDRAHLTMQGASKFSRQVADSVRAFLATSGSR